MEGGWLRAEVLAGSMVGAFTVFLDNVASKGRWMRIESGSNVYMQDHSIRRQPGCSMCKQPINLLSVAIGRGVPILAILRRLGAGHIQIDECSREEPWSKR